MGLEFNDELPGVAEPPDILERRGVEALERIANMAEARELRAMLDDGARGALAYVGPADGLVAAVLTRVAPLLSVPDQVAADDHADSAGDGGEAASLDLATVLRTVSDWGETEDKPVAVLLELLEGMGPWECRPPVGAASDLKHVLEELEAMTVAWKQDWIEESTPVEDVVQLIRDMRAPNYAAKRTEAKTDEG